MTLTTRTPMRPCGKRFSTEEEAQRSKLALAGTHGVVPCSYGCEGWHLERKQAPRNTDPTPKARAIVLERDGYACARCGSPAGPGIAPYSLQHRKARGVGGDSSIPNLVLLCGTATTGCHGEVEARESREDIAKGYRLEAHQEPGLEPVMYFSPHGSGFTAWLCEDGSLVFEAPAGGSHVA